MKFWLFIQTLFYTFINNVWGIIFFGIRGPGCNQCIGYRQASVAYDRHGIGYDKAVQRSKRPNFLKSHHNNFLTNQSSLTARINLLNNVA